MKRQNTPKYGNLSRIFLLMTSLTTAVHQPDPASDWLRKLIPFHEGEVLHALFELFLKYVSKYLLPNLVDYLSIDLQSFKVYFCVNGVSPYSELPWHWYIPWYSTLLRPENTRVLKTFQNQNFLPISLSNSNFPDKCYDIKAEYQFVHRGYISPIYGPW